MGHGILGEHGHSGGRDHFRDAVMYFRVNMVRMPGKKNREPVLFFHALKNPFPDAPQLRLEAFHFRRGLCRRRAHLGFAEPRFRQKFVQKNMQPVRELFGFVQPDKRREQLHVPLFKRVDVQAQDVRVACDHRAVVVVVRSLFVEVVGHAGVEDGVHALFH